MVYEFPNSTIRAMNFIPIACINVLFIYFVCSSDVTGSLLNEESPTRAETQVLSTEIPVDSSNKSQNSSRGLSPSNDAEISDFSVQLLNPSSRKIKFQWISRSCRDKNYETFLYLCTATKSNLDFESYYSEKSLKTQNGNKHEFENFLPDKGGSLFYCAIRGQCQSAKNISTCIACRSNTITVQTPDDAGLEPKYIIIIFACCCVLVFVIAVWIKCKWGCGESRSSGRRKRSVESNNRNDDDDGEEDQPRESYSHHQGNHYYTHDRVSVTSLQFSGGATNYTYETDIQDFGSTDSY